MKVVYFSKILLLRAMEDLVLAGALFPSRTLSLALILILGK
jgi:hypothetical protein